MGTILDLIRKYSGIASLLGMSLVQLLNLQPSPESLIIYIAFSILTVVAVGDWLAILGARRQVRRGTNLVWEPTYGLRARRAAAIALVLTPFVYAILTLFYHIPNAWPVLVRAGSEPRATSLWLRTAPGRALLGLPDDAVAALFVPGEEFTISQERIHYIAVNNRSTLASPPINLRLIFHPLQGAADPPAQPYILAVVSPAAHAWRPFGRLQGRIPLARAFSGPVSKLDARPDWLNYRGLCEKPPDVAEWCFTEFPRFPITRSTWRDPELRLPSIPPRGSFEVYLEFAFREIRPGSIPITLVLLQAEDGPFPVHVRKELDL